MEFIMPNFFIMVMACQIMYRPAAKEKASIIWVSGITKLRRFDSATVKSTACAGFVDSSHRPVIVAINRPMVVWYRLLERVARTGEDHAASGIDNQNFSIITQGIPFCYCHDLS